MKTAMSGRRFAAAAPAIVAIAAVAIYAILLLPILLRHHAALSAFIVAGDRFVTASLTPAPIVVAAHSSGYDGQFYYALAVHPFTTAPVTAGVRFDHPAWRAQRIFYPLLAHMLSLGRAWLVPAALFAINLAALCAIAVMAVAHGRGAWFAALLIIWPGWMIALTHDTTELLACAFLLAALLAYLRDRLPLFAVLAALAALTRETASLMLAGIVVASLYDVRRRRAGGAGFDRRAALYAALALVPFLLWHGYLAWAWHGVPDAARAPGNIGFPLVGVVTRMAAAVGSIFARHGGVMARLLGLYALAVAIALVGAAIVIARSAVRVAGKGGAAAGIAVGWGCMMALMSVLSAAGPWIEPTATFRAFSECWVAGWLILALDGRTPRWLPVMVPLAVANWLLCLVQLKGGVVP